MTTPSSCVNYHDGVAYARWLTQRTGHTYRLPSEAEWEYATRAGTTTSYSWGEELGTGHAHCDGCNDSPPRLRPMPGGSFPPNAFGLYDASGKVWKWLADCWNPTYVGAPADGSAWETGNCLLRGRRGGSWFNVSEARPGLPAPLGGALREPAGSALFELRPPGRALDRFPARRRCR